MIRALALLALLVFPSVAAAETLEGESGAVKAVMTFTPVTEGIEYRDVRVTVTRGGAVVWDEALNVPDCAVPYCRPVDVVVRDLDTDGEPEVLVAVYTGGAHCCTVTMLLGWTGSRYDVRHHNWLDAGYTIEDPDGDGRPELMTADARFRYEFASFAASAFPVQVWQVDGGRFEDVTAGFPTLVRRDAARWYRIWRGRAGKPRREPHGALAAWAADMEVLGQRARVTRELRIARRRGWLPKGFERALHRFLRSTGYRR